MRPLRVLIVDDSSFMRKSIKSVVEKAGHKVVGMAKDGLEGFNLYKEKEPDLVIMDVTMRGVDGIEGTKLIKQEFPNANVVFMSLVDDEKVVSQAKELGALDYLGKKEHQKLFDIMKQLSQQEQ